MEPPRLRDAGASPRLDKLAPSGSRPGCGLDEQHTGHHPPGCRLRRMPGAAARLAVASPPCRWMITHPAVLDACWSLAAARWLDAGASPRLWDGRHHQGTAAMDAGASQEPAAAIN